MRTMELKYLTSLILELFSLSCCVLGPVSASGVVVYAINAGGGVHVDQHGVHYKADPLHGYIGIASDFGKRLLINRVEGSDAIIYQTERYHYDSFSYDIPIDTDASYVIVLKFCEVYFTASHQKVFDVMLNGQHLVIKNLDIYDKVGQGTAHDEYIPFTISKAKLMVNREVSTFDGVLTVEFVKGLHDNPKVNAIVVLKGTMEDVAMLPPIPGVRETTPAEDESESVSEETDEDDITNKQTQKHNKPRKTSGPRVEDPYFTDESSVLIPILISIAVFIPTLLCLCRL